MTIEERFREVRAERKAARLPMRAHANVLLWEMVLLARMADLQRGVAHSALQKGVILHSLLAREEKGVKK